MNNEEIKQVMDHNMNLQILISKVEKKKSESKQPSRYKDLADISEDLQKLFIVLSEDTKIE